MTETTIEEQKREAQLLLSNPEFDVSEFVKIINIHYANRHIVKALGTNADIVLGLVGSGEYSFLEKCPHFIDPAIFEQIKDQGYETWHREETKKNRMKSEWWGVIISDNLAMQFRALGNKYNRRYNFEVIKDADLKKVRKRWKGVNMLPYGEHVEELPVYQIRESIWNYAEDTIGLAKNSWRSNRKTNSEFYWYTNSWNRRFKFTVLQSGKTQVRVDIHAKPGEVLTKDDKDVTISTGHNNYYGSIKVTKKFNISEPDLPFKILDWAATATKDNQEFFQHNPIFKQKLDSERAHKG